MPLFQALCLCVCRRSVLHRCQHCKFPPVPTESMAREVNRDDGWSQPGSLTITSALSVFNIAGGKGAPGNSLDAQRFQSLHK